MAENGSNKQFLQIPRVDEENSSHGNIEEITRFDGKEMSESVTPQNFAGGYAGATGGGSTSLASKTERKRGHRRVTVDGQVTYKKKPVSELMSAIQLGIGQSIGSLTPKPKRDVLYEDFNVVDTVVFPSEGSSTTPAHHYSDFKFKTFAPVAFRYFRELFNIRAEDFLYSLCIEPLQELSNAGASGSIFYITNDDEFIIKTVQHKEAAFLQSLLPGYYMNLNQNPCTLLPKFYGLYCYQCGGKNIRFVVMNNLLPSYITIHEKYDLKGSTYKRRASRRERAKTYPTLKDLDFMELNADGLLLEPETHSALVKTIYRDCRVLQSFKIMDYSLLLGIHKVDKSVNIQDMDNGSGSADCAGVSGGRRKSLRPRVAIYTTALESIQAANDTPETVCRGGIPAVNSRGEQLLLYIGIIDILQSYRLSKKLEHALKAMVLDGDTISVHQPGFYAQRFQNFFTDRVFTVKASQLKRKSVSGRKKSIPQEGETKVPGLTECSRRPDILPQSTPPRPLSVSISLQENVNKIGSEPRHVHLYTRHEGFVRHRELSSSEAASSQFSISVASLTTSTASRTGVATSFTSSSPSKLSVNSEEIKDNGEQSADTTPVPQGSTQDDDDERTISQNSTLPCCSVLVSEETKSIALVAVENESTKL